MRASWRSSMVLGLGLTALAASACSNGDSNGNAANSGGSVILDMSLAPTNARCAVITATPQTGTAVTQSFTLTPEAQTVFSLNNLPLGTVTLTEQVFTVACNATATATAAWVAQPVTISIQAGEPVTVALTLVPNSTSGQVTVQNTFVTPTPVLKEFVIAAGSRTTLSAMTSGPDGAVWSLANVSSEEKGGPNFFAVFRLSTSGLLTEFDPPDVEKGTDIVAGPDGNLWYAGLNESTSFVARLTPSGTFTFFDLFTDASGNELRASGITVGTDGNLWFTEVTDSQIGRLTVTGNITYFPITTGTTGLGSIAGGPDGNLWFTETTPSRIGRMSKTGSLVEFSTPTASSLPQAITAGPDGNLWFIEAAVDKIGRISTTGSIVEFSSPSGANLISITAGPDGNMWFTDSATNSIGQITTALGTITEFPLETASRGFTQIAVGSDGSFYLGETTGIAQYHP